MKNILTIKNGRVIDPRNDIDEIKDIHIRTDGENRAFDATGMIIVPGLVDMHVHFREPGATHKEDIKTGSQAAARGGYTTVCCMPNTIPVIDNEETAAFVNRRGKEVDLVNLLIVGALSKGQNGQELADYEGMKRAGICALSDDGKTLTDNRLMRRAAERAKELGLLITDHAEDEASIVARDIALVKATGARIHLQHISAKESVALIREAKKQGLPITAETAPHYFGLTREALATHGANAKMNPPLREEADRLAIIEALRDGTFDTIATDHAPHSAEEKALPLGQTPFGVVGLETAFAVSYTLLIKTGLMSLTDLNRLMSVNPAQLLGLRNTENDWAVFDINTPYEINRENFASKGKNTPFHGMRVYGRTALTVRGGKVIYSDRPFN